MVVLVLASQTGATRTCFLSLTLLEISQLC